MAGSGVFLPVVGYLPVKTLFAAFSFPCPWVSYSSELLSTSEGNSGQEKVVLWLVALAPCGFRAFLRTAQGRRLKPRPLKGVPGTRCQQEEGTSNPTTL